MTANDKRRLRKNVARVLTKGFDVTWERLRFSLTTAQLALDAIDEAGYRLVRATELLKTDD